MRFAILLCSILGLLPLQAQESPTPSLSPTPSRRQRRPRRRAMFRCASPCRRWTERSASGFTTPTGKLVRVLHREDEISDFTAGHDALETEWDGNDEHGHPLPNGKYRARGFVVGDLKVEGVDYFFNDWVTDENSPHLLRFTQLG